MTTRRRFLQAIASTALLWPLAARGIGKVEELARFSDRPSIWAVALKDHGSVSQGEVHRISPRQLHENREMWFTHGVVDVKVASPQRRVPVMFNGLESFGSTPTH